MSEAWNVTCPEEQLDQLRMRARHVLSQLQAVLVHTYDRKSVSEIARILGCTRNKVIWMQHVLQLRTARGTGDVGLGKYPRGEVAA